MAVVFCVATESGVKKGKRGERKELWSKRRTESDVSNLRRDINRLKRER